MRSTVIMNTSKKGHHFPYISPTSPTFPYILLVGDCHVRQNLSIVCSSELNCNTSVTIRTNLTTLNTNLRTPLRGIQFCSPDK